ncbi:hypothetical protein N182_18645 [Sinorhizobium sp. GL2]|nr:hypothetical protein N182_18645 [Sinorhizobium sp. GL2]
MADTANTVYRDFVTDGVPSSGKNRPKKADIRRLLTGYETIINAFFGSGGKIYQTKAALTADLAPAVNSSAWVMEDPIAANNGVYRKVGGTGTGSWVRAGDLPFSFIIASDVGAGTPNAIQATTSIPVSGSALVWTNVFETNTASPVTISFNGGSTLTIKTNSGNNPSPAGGLQAGMIIIGIVSGSTFRLISDQASAAIIAQAEAAAAAAAAAFDALADLTSSRLAIKLKRATVAGQTDYALDQAVPVANAHTLISVWVDGILQPKDGVAYTVINSGATLHLSSDPGVADLYVEGAAAYANPLPVDFGDVSDVAQQAAEEKVTSIFVTDLSEMSLMSRVTDSSATDWASFINQAISDMNAASGGRGGVIQLPNRNIPVSTVSIGTIGGITLRGPYHSYWEGGPFGANFVGLAAATDMFVVGSTAQDTQAFTIEKARIDASQRTGGNVFRFSRLSRATVRQVTCFSPRSYAFVAGGVDVLFELAHCESYRVNGVVVDGSAYRVDRVEITSTNIVGSGTETALTNTGPALKLIGEVHTVDANTLRMVKVNRGIHAEAAAGKRPQFVHLTNSQFDYVGDKCIYASDLYDLKMSEVYANTTLGSNAFEFGTNVERVKLMGGGIGGAYDSAIVFAGKGLDLVSFDFQDWNRHANGSPCIDLASGFGRFKMIGCTVGEWGAETTPGGGAGTIGVRINSGTGASIVKDNFHSSGLSTFIQNNGTGTLEQSGNVAI